MKTVALGREGLTVPELSYGCMGLTTFYGTRLSDNEIENFLREVYSRGINFWDTGNLYTYFDDKGIVQFQDEIIGRVARDIGRDKVIVAVKFCEVRTEPKYSLGPCGDPALIKQYVQAVMQRMGTDYIDLVYLSRVDQEVPIEVSMYALKQMVKAGSIRYIGLSECSAKTLRRAHRVHPVSCVQMEYSLWSREVEKELLPTCAELGVGLVAYSPIGRGFFSGAFRSAADIKKNAAGDADYRSLIPRFEEENLQKNMPLLDTVEAMAKRKGVSMPQLAIAWLLHQQKRTGGAGLVPIPGTTKLKNLDSNIAATDVKLSDEDLSEFEKALSAMEVYGDRYMGKHMQAEIDDNPELPPEKATQYYD